MFSDNTLDNFKENIKRSKQATDNLIERIESEMDFANAFIELHPKYKEQWRKLFRKAAEVVSESLVAEDEAGLATAVNEAEQILSPIGKAAKQYTVHCCGHAHIDMNWMWGWPETVNVTHDTFMTVDTLMNEFPEFLFSQSQASTYIAMEKYCPEIFEMIGKRIREGRWEVIASTWVEGEKNFASGESLCRHLLYTRKYFKEKFDLNPEDVKIDWSPDTFGHAHTVPSVLSKGGVGRYYHMRTGPGPALYRWRSPDGSEIISFNEKDPEGYNGSIHPGISLMLCDFLKDYPGLRDFLHIYGVGDHGGGPTRKDLRKIQRMQNWPIYPSIAFSTVDRFFTAVEDSGVELPLVDRDLNFIFDGCYTSQSAIKYANRVMELALPEAETLALIAGCKTGMVYPLDQFEVAWRDALFCHFHDILPGSGVKATALHASGLFQEVQAFTSSVKNRALRRLASEVDTASVVGVSTLDSALDNGLGAGVGDAGVTHGPASLDSNLLSNTMMATRAGATSRGAGAPGAEPILVYNSRPWERTETVVAKVWNKPLEGDYVVVRDAERKGVRGQIIDRGAYWGHDYVAVAFKAEDIPALGYKTFAVDAESEKTQPGACKAEGITWGIYDHYFTLPVGRGYIENELLKVGVDFASGALFSIVDKETGQEYVKPGELFGALHVWQETPHAMSSWSIGHAPVKTVLDTGAQLKLLQSGTEYVSLCTDHVYNSSKLNLEISLCSGSRQINFRLRTRWTEIGTPQTGVPMLRMAFPTNVTGGKATYEIPFGAQQRPQGAQEIPALKWADLSDNNKGITLTNNCKNGYCCEDDTLWLTLIRSSYEPDPIPEVGDHDISIAIVPHTGGLDIVDATMLGENFNNPMDVVSASLQDGELPSEQSFAKVLTPNVFVSAIKKAEHSEGILVRMFETLGQETEAKIDIKELCADVASAVETDVLERPLENNTAKLENGILSVTVPAYGQASVLIK